MDIKVSVIIAVYNSERYIRTTLDSIINQTLKEIEILCVDDGSSDSSIEILNEYAAKDNRVKVLYQKEPSDGAAAARNMGIAHASGEFLSVLDADDFFELDMLEKAYNKAASTASEVVIYDGYVYDDCLNVDKEIGYILHTELIDTDIIHTEEYCDSLFLLTIGAAWNCLFKKSLIDEFAIEFKKYHHADDLGFVYLAFACANKIAVINERLIHYRLNNSGSQAANACRWPEASYMALEDLKNELIRVNMYDRFKCSFVQCAILYINFYLEKINDSDDLVSYYNVIKNDYADRLDLYSQNEDTFINPMAQKILFCIKELSADEYQHRRVQGLYPFDSASLWKSKVKNCRGVVLYGAGNVGHNIFEEIRSADNVGLIGWADKNYAALGYPIVNPSIVLDSRCEIVLVAVAERSIYNAIKNDLIAKGVNEDIIIWIGE